MFQSYQYLHTQNFEYIIGEEKTNEIDTDVNNFCSFGIHLSHKDWAVKFGSEWSDLAILELRVLIKDILPMAVPPSVVPRSGSSEEVVIPTECDGKVRTSKAFVVRELSETEW